MTRIMPQTLRGWLVMIVLSTLVISQSVLILTLLGERRAVANDIFQTETFARIQWALHRLQAAPPEGRPSLETLLASPSFVVRIADAPAVDAAGMDPRRSEVLGRVLAGDSAREVRVQNEGGNTIFFRPAMPAPVNWTAIIEAPATPAPPWAQLGATFEITDLATTDGTDLDATAGPPLVASVGLGDGQWLNVLSSPLASYDPVSSLMLAGGATALLLTFVAVWGAGRVARPLEALGMAANQIDRDATYPLPPERGPADVRKAIGAFNEMARRVRRMLSDQRVLLQSVGHDLRTPLSSLRIWLEFVEDTELRGRMIASVDEIDSLTADAIDAARGDSSSEEIRTLDLASLAEAVCSDQADLDRPVSFLDSPFAPVRGRVNELRRAIRNLVDNAVRHGGAAEVRVESGGGTTAVVVCDRGPGIPEADLERVTAPFVQLDKARTGPNRGHGLGLAIVDSVARRYDGRLVLGNRSEGGVEARLVLPQARPAA